MKKAIEQDPRWLLLGDSNATGQFYYGVITTGIYCRPGCPSRRPNPDNVRFFETIQDAETAGFRPCKRCHPQHASTQAIEIERVTALCRYIENAANEPDLAELANYIGWSSYHLQRTFKKVTGVSPKIYARQVRQRSEDATPALNNKNKIIDYTISKCSLGYVLIAWSKKGICSILLDDNPEFLLKDLHDRFQKADIIGSEKNREEQIQKILNFIETPKKNLDLPLDIQGTLFQQRVWQALQKIPAGETRSYSDIAITIGSPGAVRAVASACAANAIAVVVPCHRVVRQDGSLSGYRWGIERKQELLEKEKTTKEKETKGKIM